MDRIEKIKEFLAQQPNDSFLQHALALEYIKLGKDEEAKKLFHNVLELDPSYIGTYYHLAKLYERNEKVDEAVKIYEKGMQEAKKAGEDHAFGELRSAYEELVY